MAMTMKPLRRTRMARSRSLLCARAGNCHVSCCVACICEACVVAGCEGCVVMVLRSRRIGRSTLEVRRLKNAASKGLSRWRDVPSVSSDS
jgi:hypothetical protein